MPFNVHLCLLEQETCYKNTTSLNSIIREHFTGMILYAILLWTWPIKEHSIVVSPILAVLKLDNVTLAKPYFKYFKYLPYFFPQVNISFEDLFIFSSTSFCPSALIQLVFSQKILRELVINSPYLSNLNRWSYLSIDFLSQL